MATTPNSTSMPSAEYRFSVLPDAHSEASANGSDNGSDSRMTSGCTRLSYCAASTMYMKTIESRNAQPNSTNVRSSSRPRPATDTEYAGGMLELAGRRPHRLDAIRQPEARRDAGAQRHLALPIDPIDA